MWCSTGTVSIRLFMTFSDEGKPQLKPDFYLYRLIEILLPKAMVEKQKKDKKASKDAEHIPKLKMVELWAQNEVPRKGWLKVVGLGC